MHLRLPTANNCLLLAVLVLSAGGFDAVNGQDKQQGSGLGSIFSGLLGSITQTASVDTCPGKCIHALASLLCDGIKEDVSCPSKNMRCCVEEKSGSAPPAPSKASTTPAPASEDSSSSASGGSLQGGNSQQSASGTLKKCPGVCVAERMSEFCETILDIDDMCKRGLKCCVAKEIFNGKFPDELVFPNKKGSGKATTKKTTTTTTTTTTTKRPTTMTTNRPRKSDGVSDSCRGTCVTGFFALLCDDIDRSVKCPGGGRCCVSKRSKKRKPKPTKPPQKQKCPGVCIPQVMSSFCTLPSKVIKKSACKQGTICCKSEDQANEKESAPTPAPTTTTTRRTTKRTTTRRPPSRPRPQRPSGGGGGGDFSSLLLGVAPQLLAAATGNSGAGSAAAALLPVLAPALGSIFSGSGGGAGSGAARPPQNSPDRVSNVGGSSGGSSGGSGLGGAGALASLLVPALGSFLAAPAPRPPPPRGNKVPPFLRPSPPPPTTTTTTTTTTTERPDNRPECPGTCIGSYLSFTCFSNAAMTDLFKCEKKKTTCCSPKADIKRRENFLQNRREFNQPRIPGRNSIRRNDSFNSLDYPFPIATQNERPTLEHPVTNKYVCGVKGTYRSGKVVGGEDATPSEWCWQVALINSLNQYLCGGALIGTQWVLTAAHCVTNIVRAGDAIYVRVGDHDLTQKFGSPGAQTLRVATTYIHHNHNSQTLDNDIAILKLHGEAELKDGVCLVCLPARGTSQSAGKRCTVTGYGYMGESGPIPLRVREAQVPIVNDNECVREINAVTEKIFILPASSFCAGGEESHDACQGDGGGPLVCEDDGYYELTGLVSWGFGCGRKDVPGVYVKISSFIGWINQIISVNNL